MQNTLPFPPSRLLLAVTLGALSSLSACSGGGNNPQSGGDMASSPDQSSSCSHTVQCTDQSIQQLGLFRPVNTGTVDNTADGAGFISTINATAGGSSATKSFVYAKFTAQGLTRVEVGDEDAFTSTDWDIAFRRFVIRVNNGISGPSCVTAARTANGTTFDALSAAPAGLDYRTEEYFTATCDYIPDGSGLGSPGVALQSFWEYQGCVKMTGNVFVVKLADGRQAKLEVKSYYTPSIQDTCNTTDAIPDPATSGAANVKIRWAFL